MNITQLLAFSGLLNTRHPRFIRPRTRMPFRLRTRPQKPPGTPRRAWQHLRSIRARMTYCGRILTMEIIH